MPAGFVSDSNLKFLKEQNKRINSIVDQLIFSPAANATPQVFNNFGPRDAANGPAVGVESNTPVSHTLQDLVTPGTFDTIILQTTNALVDYSLSSALNLKWIQGKFNDGVRVLLQGPVGKTLNLLSGGSFAIPSAYALTDQDYAIATYDKSQDKFRVIKTGSGSGGTTLWSGITIDANKDMAGKGLSNLDYVAFNVAVTQYINGTPTTLDYDTPTGTVHQFKVNAVTKLSVTSLGISVNGGIIAAVTEMDFVTAGMSLSSSGGTLHYNVPSGGSHNFNYSGSQRLKVSASAVTLTGAFLEFGASNRVIYQGSGIRTDVPTGESIQFAINSVDKVTISSGNTSFNSTSIVGVAGITFSTAGQLVITDSSGLHFLAPTGDILEFLINGVTKFTVSSSTVSADILTLAFSLVVNNGGADPSANGEIARNGSDLKVRSGGVTKNLTQLPQLNSTNTYTGSNLFNAGLSVPNTFFFILNNNGGSDSYIRMSSTVGVTPKVVDIASWADICFKAIGESSSSLSRGLVRGMSKSGDPSTSEIPSGYFTVAKNTSTGAVKAWYNDSGVLKSVTLS